MEQHEDIHYQFFQDKHVLLVLNYVDSQTLWLKSCVMKQVSDIVT